MSIKTAQQQFIIFALSTVLIACGGGGGGSDADTSSPPNSNSTSGNSTTGGDSSGDNSGQQTEDPATEKTVTLSWNAPTTRENGDPLQLSEISGYEIYYFLDSSSSDDSEVASINNPSTVSYVTPTLTSGTYYFSIVTIDSSGLYSDLSDYITVIIP